MTLLEKSIISDQILGIVLSILGYQWNEDKDALFDKNNVLFYWDDMDSLELKAPIPYENHIYDSINVFGDGTMEFHNEEYDSINWAEFDEEFLLKVLNQVNEY